MANLDLQINNYNVIINTIVILAIVIILYNSLPYLYNTDDTEDYAPDRERTDPQSDWNIIEEIRTIRERQENNIRSLSQQRKYDNLRI